ncbi:MAG: metalloregulator ArsR/SmtB family transcription factor [bacterium]|nr:metalloregulator ArsR/SmtB family transcription factor [bacterium]
MYSEVFELHAELLKALSHPRRLEILRLLRDQELCVSDIYEMLDLPQANISQHLMILRDAEVLSSRKDGKQVFYSIANKKILAACDLFREVLIEQTEDAELARELRLSMQELLPLTHDPVCQMRVSPKTASFAQKHAGEMFYFCASGCKKKFAERPDAYVKK